MEYDIFFEISTELEIDSLIIIFFTAGALLTSFFWVYSSSKKTMYPIECFSWITSYFWLINGFK